MNARPDPIPEGDGESSLEAIPSPGRILARCRFAVDPVRLIIREAAYADDRPWVSPDWRLWYIQSGRGEIRQGAKTTQIHKRDLLCFRPGDRVRGKLGPSAGGRFFVVNWSPLDTHLSQALEFPERARMGDDWAETLFSAAHADECGRRDGGHGDSALHRLVFLLTLFQGMERRGLIKIKADYGKSDAYRRLLRVLDHLDGNLSRKFSLSELGEVAGLDRTTVIRLFKKYMRTTPADWYRRRRLEGSRHLLIQGIAVKEVARHCGFPDPFTYSKAFKTSYGVSPTEYLRAKARDRELLTWGEG